MNARPTKQVRIAQMRARLDRYEQQHEELELDVVAARATKAENADEAVRLLREQQTALERAHAAILDRLTDTELEKDD